MRRSWFLVGLLCGCKSLPVGAREYFAQKYSCPDERVEVTLRSGASWASILPPSPPRRPTDEVAKDPARMAKWQRDQTALEEAQNEERARKQVFDVRGCDHHLVLGCAHAGGRNKISFGSVTCHEAPIEPALADAPMDLPTVATPSSQPAAAPLPPKIAPPPAPGADREDIAKVMRKSLPMLRLCYERELAKNARLAGKVTVQFTIEAAGTVGKASVRDSTMNDQTVQKCLVQTVKRLRFAPNQGEETIVNYPFVFQSR